MPNIKEIAKQAGVSVTTVSRVLNNHPYVASDKRERVQKVIQELDYIPNRSATNLALGKTNTVGVILPYNDHPWFDKVVKGVLDAAFRKKYSVTLFPTGYNAKTEEKYLMMLKTKQVDGLIIASRANTLELISEYAEYGPIVVSEETSLPGLSSAYIDRSEAYQEGFRFLKERGYHNVCFTNGRARSISPSTRNKMKAFEAVFGKKAKNYALNDCYTVQDGIRAAEYFFEEKGMKPDAFYANGDEVAAGIMVYARQKGMRVPEDIAILGQENLPIGLVLELTTLDHHLKKMGETAFSIFYSKEIRKERIAHELIIRKSV
ncbi:LacI family DNA-binding transcriptional regulator [Listeria fleischmannii]|uniref:LacI family DNA-binding transcriptional regulator n=1 Tax=Listeria fleischmannii TaxID=1069827 RepID=UPI00162406A8|nr:LacI family DNA-binding transcriptional regulator [Listeria fleischmannii]MBC1419414.1 LacI family DNA-binding transcriptional regulator [Listeria fleischmannii]